MADQKDINAVVRIEHLAAYRAKHGLEIVKVFWGYRDPRPTMVCRPITPAAATVAPGPDDEQPPTDQTEA